MKTLLNKLKKLSDELIDPSEPMEVSPTTMVTILRYRQRLETRLTACINSTEYNPTHQLRFFAHQAIQLSDRIYQSFSEAQKQKALAIHHYSPAGALSETLQTLDALLSLLKDYGKIYFDDTLKVPDYLLRSTSDRLKQQFDVVGVALKNKGLPVSLHDILYDYFNGFGTRGEKVFSFRDLRYAHKLLRGLQRTRPHEDPACMISGLLVYLNFNKVSLLDFCKAWMKNLVDQAESFHQLLAKLTDLRKEVFVQEENKHWSYDHEHISLKEHLMVLLDAELIHLENVQEKQQHLDALQNNEYFIMDTTVKQLDLWADINVKLKIIPHHSALQVIKVVTRYVRTPKSGVIAYDSARKKLSEIDDATIKGLHNSLSLQKAHLENEYPHLF